MLKDLLINLRNINSKRFLLTGAFMFLCYKLITFSGLAIDQSTIFVGLLGVIMWWFKSEENKPSGMGSSNRAFGTVDDNKNRPSS